MRLYNSIGPNPRVVRMAAAEKGIALDLEEVDVIAGECRREPYLAINPYGTLPALRLDDGVVLAEVLPIAEYFEELTPQPPLIGATALERARTRMWTRRIDLGFALPLTLGFRAMEGRAMFEPRLTVAPEVAGPALKAMAFDTLDFLEAQCGGQAFVAGGAFTIADILLFSFIEFARAIGMDPLGGRPWLTAWHPRVAARPSAAV